MAQDMYAKGSLAGSSQNDIALFRMIVHESHKEGPAG